MTTMINRTTSTAAAGDDVSAASAALRALAAAEGGEVLAGQLSRLVAVIANEAVRTKRFRTDLLAALVPEPAAGNGSTDSSSASSEAPTTHSPSLTRSQLTKLTKPELQRLIDREGMDPDRTIKAKTTKNQMIDLILAIRASSSAAAPESPASDAASAAPAESTSTAVSPGNPPKRRRQPSALNPYAVAASDGVQGLREQLQHLDVEQLKDIVSEYGMNHDRRAMGWTEHGRFVDRIVEKTDFGATQGSAFRSRS